MKLKDLLLILLTLSGSVWAMAPEEDWDQPEEQWGEEANMFPGLEDDLFREMMWQEAAQANRQALLQPTEQVQPQLAQLAVPPELEGYEQYKFGRPITFRQYYHGDAQLGIVPHKPFVDREVQLARMLQLSGFGLISLDGIEDVPNIRDDLRSLLLSNNLFDAIPPVIGTLLPNLKRLYMGQNRVAEIPSFIFGLRQLEWLELNHNRITKLPIQFNRLQALTRLVLSNNKISITMQTEVPDFGAIPHLHEVYLYNNPISLGDDELRKQLNLHPTTNLYFKSHAQERVEFEFLDAIKSANEERFRTLLKRILTERLVPIGWDSMGDELIHERINIANIRDDNGNNILHVIVDALGKKMQQIQNSPDLSDAAKEVEFASAEKNYIKLFLRLFDLAIPQMQQMLFTPNAGGQNVIAAAIGAESGLHGLLLKTLLNYAYAVEPRVTAQETACLLRRLKAEKEGKEKEEKEFTDLATIAREQKDREDRMEQERRERAHTRQLLHEVMEEEARESL